MTYGVVRAFQVIVNTLESSPEKAGVGGSTPSLATTFSSTYDEAEQLMSPNYIPPELARCLRLGRHRDLNIVLVTLRLAELARGATALADAFIVCGAIT